MNKRKKPTTLPLGSISHGTLRAEDVIPEMIYLGHTIRMSRDDRNKARELEATWDALPDLDTMESQETADEVWASLDDLLNCYTPAFCYFGSHEGDGSDIGVWISTEALESARRDGIVTENGEFIGTGVTADVEYRLVVSDHGNMTLYDRKGKEVWGVV